MLAALVLLPTLMPSPSAFKSARVTPRAPPSTLVLRQLLTRLNPAAAENSLFSLVEGSGRKRAILDAFKELEAAAPTPDDLLLGSRGVLVNGRWELLGSIAAVVGDEDDIVESGISNAINASGIVVDADTARRPVQEIDVARCRIANELYRPLPLGQSGIIRVAGSFEPRPEAASGRRAYVNFDALEFFLETDAGAVRMLSLGFLFALIRAVRPALTDGDADGPWLETTYLTERTRLGRGNKGSIFVLRRSDDDGDSPLAAFPL